MSWRRLPPVHSPLSAAAIGAGVGAALIPARARLAQLEVEDWLRSTYTPVGWCWTDSGTSALALALRMASDGGKRLVALPAYGCFDLATACDAANVKVILYDLDPATLGPDWISLEAALDAGAGAVVVVHLYGIPVDLDQVGRLAASRGAVVVEDAAQGVGGSWRGKPLGAHGALSVLSFGRGKGNTSGGGGVLLAHSARFAEDLPSLPVGPAGAMVVLKTLAQYLLGRPSLYAIPASLPILGLGETVYRPPAPSTQMSAAGYGILSRSILELGRTSASRREAARVFLQRLPLSLLPSVGDLSPGSAGYLRLPLLVQPAERHRLLALGDCLGLRGGYPLPLGALPAPFAARLAVSRSGPGAERLVRELVTVPIGTPGFRRVEDRIVALLREAVLAE